MATFQGRVPVSSDPNPARLVDQWEQGLQAPAGTHYNFSGGGDPFASGFQQPTLEANQSGFDPALFGAELIGGPFIGLMNSAATGNFSPLSLALTAASFAGGANPFGGGVASQAINSGASPLAGLGRVGQSVAKGVGTNMAGNSILNLLFGNQGGGGSTAGNILASLSANLGAAAGGLAAQKGQQAGLASALAGANQNQYQDALSQALLKQIAAPQQGADMARQGDLLANVQDMQANFTPGAGYSFSGGLRPSALGPNARAAGQALSNAGLGIAQGGLQLPSVPNLTAGFPSPQAGTGQNLLNAGAAGTGILSTLLNQGQSPLQQLLNRLMQQGGQQNPDPTGGDGMSPTDPGYDDSGGQ